MQAPQPAVPALAKERTRHAPLVLARAALVTAAIVWGAAFVGTKHCLRYMGPVDLMALRFSIGVPLLLVILLVRRVELRPILRTRAWLLGGGILIAHFFIQITGMQYTTATNTGWLITATPLAMALLGWTMLGERPAISTFIGMMLAAFGIVLLVSKGRVYDLGWLSSVGDWMVLASAFTWALYSIATRKLVRERDPVAVTLAMLLPVAVLSTAHFAATGRVSLLSTLPSSVVIALLFVGVLGTALAHWFWQVGLAGMSSARAGMFLFIEPLATTAVAVPLLDEEFGLTTAVGAALVVVGVWWSQVRR